MAGAVVFFDQFTKAWARTDLNPGESLPVIRNFFHLTLIENRGIAFGLFPGADKVLLWVITLSIAALGVFVLTGASRPSQTQWAVALIFGGAVGNWIDRIRNGAVTDFLDFRIWPVFNFADSAITVGVALFLFDLLRQRHVS